LLTFKHVQAGPVLGSAQPPLQWVWGTFCGGISAGA
jgi:hypothetical protein